MPSMGSPVEGRRADLSHLRRWRVREFEDFLIFYLPLEDGVDIVRVIYGVQDWMRIFAL